MAAQSARLPRPRSDSRLLSVILRRLRASLRERVRVRATPPPMVRGERVLATERDGTGGVVLATSHALYHRPVQPTDTAIGPGWRRLAWDEIGRVGWDSARRVLDVTGLAPGLTEPLAVPLPAHSPMVDLTRDRVAATLVVSRRIPIGAAGTALVTGRRRPGSGQVTWVVMVKDLPAGPGRHAAPSAEDDPQAHAVVADAIRHLRAELGL